MKLRSILLIAAGLLPCSLAFGELPFTFKAGDPIRASELNANFSFLDSQSKAGFGGTLTRKKTNLSNTSFKDVVTVPDTSTNGWVLRSFVAGCDGLLLKINDDPSVPANIDAPLVVRPGETLAAKCPSSASGDATVGYFMFNEQ
jgi:hypothetical protein